jgi:hypothetical protein
MGASAMSVAVAGIGTGVIGAERLRLLRAVERR